MYKGEAAVAYTLHLKDGEAIIAFQVPKGGALAQLKQGDRLLVKIDRPRVAATKLPTALRTLAGRWCNDRTFQQWLSSTFPEEWAVATAQPWWHGKPKQIEKSKTAAVVRDVCEVKSRTEFDTDELAARRFHHLIRGPYSDWLKARFPKTITHRPTAEASR